LSDRGSQIFSVIRKITAGLKAPRFQFDSNQHDIRLVDLRRFSRMYRILKLRESGSGLGLPAFEQRTRRDQTLDQSVRTFSECVDLVTDRNREHLGRKFYPTPPDCAR